MKTIGRLMILAELSLVVLALGATGANAQSLKGADFAGTFTLPFEAHWGTTTQPVGEYSLYYGQPFAGGPFVVEVIGKEKGSPRAFILPQGTGSASTRKNGLVCVRDASTLLVRALEMAAIGKTVNFAMPRGAQLVAHNGKNSGYTQLAEAPVLIQRVPITTEGK